MSHFAERIEVVHTTNGTMRLTIDGEELPFHTSGIEVVSEKGMLPGVRVMIPANVVSVLLEGEPLK